MIACAVGLRSYALTMTFGLDGDIWKKVPTGRAIVFDTIWGTYFLTPLAFAILILLLEIGLVTANRRFAQRVVNWSALLLVLAFPWAGDPISWRFLQTVTRTIGSPLWLTIWGLLAFYVWAWLRGVSEAARSGLATAALLIVVGRQTIDLDGLTSPQPWPLMVIGAVLLVHGIRTRASHLCTAGSAFLTCGLWLVLLRTPISDLRVVICANLLWAALATIALSFRDPLALSLRIFVAAMFPVATLFVIASEPAVALSVSLRVLYVVLLALVCLLIARVRRNLWFLYAFGGMVGVSGYSGVVSGFHRAAAIVGRDAMTAFAWSSGALLLALLISAQKARWLPRKMWPRWHHGNEIGIVPNNSGGVANGFSADAPT
jgi:hypothetical protein